jgi:hypothetical protein
MFLYNIRDIFRTFVPFLIEKGYLYAQNTGDYQESTDY